MASVFDFFKKNTQSKKEVELESESFNEIVRQLEMQQFMYEDVYDNLDSESKTAYTILAWVCQLKHLYSNVYADVKGIHYQRTKFGYFPTKSINHTWELNHLLKSKNQSEYEFTKLLYKYTDLKATFKLITEKNEQLKNRFIKKSESAKTLHNQQTSYQIEIAKQRQQIKALESELTKTKTIHHTELGVVQRKLESANILVSELTKKVNAPQSEIPIKQVINPVTNKLNADLMAHNRSLTREVGHLKNEIETLKSELKQAKVKPNLSNMELNYITEIDALKRKEQSLFDIIDHYSKAIHKLLVQGFSLQIAVPLSNKSNDILEIKSKFDKLLKVNSTFHSLHKAIETEMNAFEQRVKSKEN